VTNVHDGGLGVQKLEVLNAANQVQGGVHNNSCPAVGVKVCEYRASISRTIANIPEGLNQYKIRATDPGGKVSEQARPIRIDTSEPDLTLQGTMFDLRETELGPTETRTLTVLSADGVPGGTPAQQRSGVEKIEIYVDGVLEHTENQAVPGDSRGLNLNWTPPRSLFTDTEGGSQYVVEVVVTDKVGHEKGRS